MYFPPVSQDSVGVKTALLWSRCCRAMMNKMRTKCIASVTHLYSSTWTMTWVNWRLPTLRVFPTNVSGTLSLIVFSLWWWMLPGSGRNVFVNLYNDGLRCLKDLFSYGVSISSGRLWGNTTFHNQIFYKGFLLNTLTFPSLSPKDPIVFRLLRFRGLCFRNISSRSKDKLPLPLLKT